MKTLGITPTDAVQIFKPTAYGISARLPLVKLTLSSGPSDSTTYLALLACKFGESTTLVALLLHRLQNAPRPQAPEYTVCAMLGPLHSEAPPTPSDLHSLPLSMDQYYVRATVLTPQQLEECRRVCTPAEVLVASRPSRAQHKLVRDIPLYRDFVTTDEAFRVRLCGWSSRLLEQQGYTTSMQDGPYTGSAITLNPGISFEDIAIDFVIGTRGGRAHDQRLKIQVGLLSTYGVQALGVAVQGGGEMQLVDGYSARADTHHSHISSWNRHGGTATKELGLLFFHGEQLTLRLVLTHEPSDSSRGAEEGRTAVYRLGAEIFGTQNKFAPSPTSNLRIPSNSSPTPAGPERRLPVVSTGPRRDRGGTGNRAPSTQGAPQLARDAHGAHQVTTGSSSTERRRRNRTSPRT